MVRRLGFVSAPLLALMTVIPTATAQACAPGSPAGATAATLAAYIDPCADQGCEQCGVVCAQGCCHAPQTAVIADPLVMPLVTRLQSSRLWVDNADAPISAPAGLERPPRA